ncbi:hypothetical protein [Candidatus Pelagibacter sp. HIMB1587]|uniref:hypothetical protein n=1 Tax=Candidatus Pelagibacter sp. HIMB1587 TaxID=3413354 RepID=UPI003F869B2D
MKNILSDNYEHNKTILYVSLLVCYAIIAFYTLNAGYSMSTDSQRFSRWADDLIKFNFNLFEFYSIDKVNHRPNLFFFSLPVILIGLCKVFFTSDWQYAFLLLNLILVFFSLTIFINILLRVKVRPILISFTLPLIVLSVDMLTWPRFILSDVIYIFLVISSVYIVLNIIINNKIDYIKLGLIILLLLSSRPSSIPVIFSIFLFMLFLKFKILVKKKYILLILLVMIISTPFIFGFFYLFLEHNMSDKPKIEFLINMVNEGMIIHDRSDTWVSSPNNFFDLVIIYALRMVNFFNPYASTFSILHILLNFIQTILIVISLTIWLFFVSSIEIKDKLYLFIILLSLSVASFHSFILIDYDWRYRFPIILPLIMFIPISLEMILKKINFRLNKSELKY